MMMTSWTLAAATALALQGATPASTVPALETISIPQELSPALMPYLACRQSEQGVALYKDGELLNPEDGAQDCDALRTRARGKVVGILKDLYLGRNRTERLEIADYWLGQIDSLTGQPANS